MARLFLRLVFLLAVFCLSMAFVALGVFSEWWYGVIGAGILVAFVAFGGMLVPSARSDLPGHDAKSAAALVQVGGALCATAFLVMAIVTWAYGNRTLFANNAYQALGLIIFLGLAGVGIMGSIGALARFAYVRQREAMERRGAHLPR